MRKFNQITLENLAKGGGMAFKAVKDKAAPLPTFIIQTVQQNFLRQRWSIHGTTRLRFSPPCVLEVGMPVVFHGQDAVLADVDGTFLHLDRPVVCKHDLELAVTQPRLEASHQGMQKLVCDAWNCFWQAPDHVDETAAEFIRNLGDCPSCSFQDFELGKWRRFAKGVKLKSARGACGFSMKDLQTMPDHLVESLFELYRAIENGMQWPEKLTLARVAMQVKTTTEHYRLGQSPLSACCIACGAGIEVCRSSSTLGQVFRRRLGVLPPASLRIASPHMFVTS